MAKFQSLILDEQMPVP